MCLVNVFGYSILQISFRTPGHDACMVVSLHLGMDVVDMTLLVSMSAAQDEVRRINVYKTDNP